MIVFLGFAGHSAKRLALALYELLPRVLPEARPWISELHVPGAVAWEPFAIDVLQQAGYAIVCVSRDGLESKWLPWELGQLDARGMESVRLLLVDVHPRELQGPLRRYRAACVCGKEVEDVVLEIGERQVAVVGPDVLRASITKAWQEFWMMSELPQPEPQSTKSRYGVSEEQLKEFMRELATRYSVRGMARMAGVSKESVRSFLADLGPAHLRTRKQFAELYLLLTGEPDNPLNI